MNRSIGSTPNSNCGMAKSPSLGPRKRIDGGGHSGASFTLNTAYKSSGWQTVPQVAADEPKAVLLKRVLRTICSGQGGDGSGRSLVVPFTARTVD